MKNFNGVFACPPSYSSPPPDKLGVTITFDSLTLAKGMSGMLMSGLIGLVIVFLIVAASSERTEAIAEMMED